MRVEFVGIVDDLEIDNPFAENIRGRVLALCNSEQNARGLLLELNHNENEDGCRGNNALYAMFKSCAYDQLNNKISAFDEAIKALKGFRDCGEEFNEALAHWFIGLLYKNYDEDHLAIPQLDEAGKLLGRCAKLNELESNYAKKTICEKLIPEINQTIETIKGKKIIAPQPPQAGQGFSSLWKSALIDFNGFASEEIVFNNKSYKFFEAQRGNVIELGPGGDCRWVKANDNSMDRATPVPIEPDDYILLDRKLKPQLNDIVIARPITPSPRGKKVHILFRYTSSGLKSESSFTTTKIPFNSVDIIIVVIAIAKLV